MGIEGVARGVAVGRHSLQHRSVGGRMRSAAGCLDELGDPRFLTAAGTTSPHVTGSGRGEAVDHGDVVAGGLVGNTVGERDSGPVAGGAGEKKARLLEEDDLAAVHPLLTGTLPPSIEVPCQGSEAAAVLEQRNEQRLAHPVVGAVERVHGPTPEQGVEDRRGQCAVAVDMALVVEEADRFRAVNGHGPLAQQTCAHRFPAATAAAVGQPCIPGRHQCQGAVEHGGLHSR